MLSNPNIEALFAGGAIGDAAGLPTEGVGRRQISTQFRRWMIVDDAFAGLRFADFDPPATFPELDKFPLRIIDTTLSLEKMPASFRDKYGVYTDDTSQLLVVIESLILNEGAVDRLDIARRLRKWANENGIGMGKNFINAVSHDDFLTKPHSAAFAFLESLSFVPAANGAVMRSAALGALSRSSESREDFHFKVADIAAITHANPRCILAAVFTASLVAGILQAMLGAELIEYALGKASEIRVRTYEADAPWTVGIENYRGRCATRHWDDALGELVRLIERIWSDDSLTSLAQIKPDCDMDDIEKAPIGYTYVPIKLLVAALKLRLPFDVAVLQIISLGGDCDTNACVVGAVLGILQPDNHRLLAWLDKILPVQKVQVLDMAARFGALLT